MRTAALILILCASVAWAKSAKTYPLTLKIVSMERRSETHQSNGSLNCSTDPRGEDTRCTSSSGQRSVIHIIQTAEYPPDPTKHVDLECAPGFGALFGQGFAAGAGGDSFYGCDLQLGEYKAFLAGTSYKILIHTAKGKEKELTLAIIKGPY